MPEEPEATEDDADLVEVFDGKRVACPHCGGELAVVYLGEDVDRATGAREALVQAVVGYSEAMGSLAGGVAVVVPAEAR